MVRVKPRYDHYENNMFLDDPIAADNTRRPAALSPKIGCEGRMGKPVDIHEERPGPQNYSPTKLGLKNAAHCSTQSTAPLLWSAALSALNMA